MDLGIKGRKAIVCASSRGLGRGCALVEFGQTCAFLCSVPAGYITGQSILMDGGVFPSTL
jgi:hypothetical protein